jgi:predicted small lipoprotein YifL
MFDLDQGPSRRKARALKRQLFAVCGRLPVGKGFLRSFAKLVGAAVCSTCWCGTGGPLAIMPSATTDPDRKHALEAQRREWVFPSSGIDRLSHYFMSALPNFVGRGARAWPDLYAAMGSR